MANRMFLYIDILGFKNLIKSGADIRDLYQIIDDLNVQSDQDFETIVFSDTIVVYGAEFWNLNPSQAIMWLVEFAQDLFYRLIVKDIHFRAYITFGDFNHYKLKNFEAYYGDALVDCYEREKEIQCTGVFLDARLIKLSNIFFTASYNEHTSFVHIMQHLDDISFPYEEYPISGYYLEAIGMESWVVYLIRYLNNVHDHMMDVALSDRIRQKYVRAWEMISTRHGGLLRRLQEASFRPEEVVEMDWSKALALVGTPDGPWG